MTVALVIVSHSDLLSRGVQEVVSQLAPDVRIIPAGGTETGEIGTSFDLVLDALTEAGNPDGVAVFADIGSAKIHAQAAVDHLVDGPTSVKMALGPIVEGTVAAAVAAQGGADLDSVVTVAERAGWSGTSTAARDHEVTGETVTRYLSLRSSQGLHARPAAVLSRLISGFNAQVTVDGVDADSVLELMGLGLTGGERITVQAHGPDADAALEAIASAIADGLGDSE